MEWRRQRHDKQQATINHTICLLFASGSTEACSPEIIILLVIWLVIWLINLADIGHSSCRSCCVLFTSCSTAAWPAPLPPGPLGVRRCSRSRTWCRRRWRGGLQPPQQLLLASGGSGQHSGHTTGCWRQVTPSRSHPCAHVADLTAIWQAPNAVVGINTHHDVRSLAVSNIHTACDSAPSVVCSGCRRRADTLHSALHAWQ